MHTEFVSKRFHQRSVDEDFGLSHTSCSRAILMLCVVARLVLAHRGRIAFGHDRKTARRLGEFA